MSRHDLSSVLEARQIADVRQAIPPRWHASGGLE
jgi:hypothetical protein